MVRTKDIHIMQKEINVAKRVHNMNVEGYEGELQKMGVKDNVCKKDMNADMTADVRKNTVENNDNDATVGSSTFKVLLKLASYLIGYLQTVK